MWVCYSSNFMLTVVSTYSNSVKFFCIWHKESICVWINRYFNMFGMLLPSTMIIYTITYNLWEYLTIV